MRQTTTLAPLHISNTVFFRGTDDEIREAEKKEQARAEELEKIFFSADFIACEYRNYYGQRRILHHSTRDGVLFQLSYIDSDGVPAMHENFMGEGDPYKVGHIGSKAELLRHYINAGNNSELTLTIITA